MQRVFGFAIYSDDLASCKIDTNMEYTRYLENVKQFQPFLFYITHYQNLNLYKRVLYFNTYTEIYKKSILHTMTSVQISVDQIF